MPRRMDTRIPVVVRMRVECARYGHTEDDTYKRQGGVDKAYEPGKFQSAARLSIGKRTQQRQ